MNKDLDKLLLEVNPRLGDGEGKLYSWLMLVDIIVSPSKYPDVERFSSLCQSGELYDLLAEKWNSIPGKRYDRDEAKKRLLKIFNSPPVFPSQEKDILRELFPNVSKVVDEINKGFEKTRKGKGRSRWKKGDQVCPFAHVTQRFEARVLLDVICNRIEKEHPNVPYLTLHDCILTTVGNEELVQEIMVEEITKIMGYPPNYNQVILLRMRNEAYSMSLIAKFVSRISNLDDRFFQNLFTIDRSSYLGTYGNLCGFES
jgi:hypothetical protein